MSRLSIPADIDELIAQVTPYISSSTNAVDVIRIALFKMKEQYIVPQKIQLDNTLHPYYARLTPQEEKNVLAAMKEKGGKKLKSKQDIVSYLNSL